jgi:hypothetical protein
LNGVIFTEVKLYIIEPDRQFKRYFSLLPKVWYAASLTYTFIALCIPLFFSWKPELLHPKLFCGLIITYKPESDIIVSFVTPQKFILENKSIQLYVNKIDNRQTVYKKLTQFKFIVFLQKTAIPDQKNNIQNRNYCLIFLQT